jgi:hypothetical protein
MTEEKEELITFHTEYIKSFFEDSGGVGIWAAKNITTKEEKWTELRETLQQMSNTNNTNKQNCSDYDQIYALGDLHADYKSFYKRLEIFGIISPPFDEEKERKIDIKQEPSLQFDLLLKLTAEFEWLPEKTLLVICGDIVDGKRGDWGIKDNYGESELLLHMFLKNLKSKARTLNSDVICIYGNHDMTLFFPNDENYLNKYVEKSATDFFGDLNIRTRWLTPFYQHNFYFVFELMNNETTEIQFAHGALHTSETNRSLYKETIELQNNALLKFDSFYSEKDELSPIWQKFLYNNNDEYKDQKSVVWQRTYNLFKEKDDKCSAVEDGPTIVVGHCESKHQTYEQTVDKNRICTRPDNTEKLIIKSVIEYTPDTSKQKTSRCIYPKCFNKSGIPKIVMVDTSMSTCFNHDYGPQMRSVEILRIRKSRDDDLNLQKKKEEVKKTPFFSFFSSPKKPEIKPFFDIYESLYHIKDKGEINAFLLNKPSPKVGGRIRRRTNKKRVRNKRGKMNLKTITQKR